MAPFLCTAASPPSQICKLRPHLFFPRSNLSFPLSHLLRSCFLHPDLQRRDLLLFLLHLSISTPLLLHHLLFTHLHLPPSLLSAAPMASSTESLGASANSQQQHFSFTAASSATPPQYFMSSLAGSGRAGDRFAGGQSFADRLADRMGGGVPKFKSLPPPSLPISPPSASPSSYFSIPAGLSPAELLDSPVLLSTSNVSSLS